ncbi:putative RNA-directed DNA polymerase from transposon BS [Merluccius polli]|uniref:RNA-directed DNA polymerase from transposon BS n=1 Tax=Merluccius polli TaxID=89951 RepID=A0AA47NPI3_MERPO|nr:putative RNA-directed DNA polymerase from transposon BS [Merluccius polli]
MAGNYKGNNSTPSNTDASLAEELNCFFARFEVRSPTPDVQSPPASSSYPLTVQECDVRRELRSVNPRKAAGPDRVPGKVLKECADQLAAVFTNIFNLSLAQAAIPSCLKTSTIIPIPKKPSPSSLNDYRPVALTPIVMKCFETLVLKHIKTSLPLALDPHQFAYRANRLTDDAIATVLHTALNHLEHSGTYVRMLFVDYSSVFNTIIPDILIRKLTDLVLSSHICCWIMDFLSNRPQTVKLGPHTSTTLTLSTGSPLAYTHDCNPSYPNNAIIKFADDTTLVGLISGGDESAYRAEVHGLVTWCKDNNLTLNTAKTKELIIDFRKRGAEPFPLHINGDSVERVHSFKFLGTLISDRLTWTDNITVVVKKARQRLHFLRLLKKNNLSERLLVLFYRSTIESILMYCVTVWYAGCPVADRKLVQRVINTAQRIIGCPLPSLEEIGKTRLLSKATKIIKDCSHPGHSLFELLPSGRCYRCLKTRTSRFRKFLS